MLIELKVNNFAIIDYVKIGFQPGLNILSGETGAGKSVLLKSLGLLMGEKLIPGVVRTGTDEASIEGMFDISDRKDVRDILQNQGIAVDDDDLVVRRVVSAAGKSKVYINGSLVSLSTLRDIVAPLIEVTGPAAPLIEMTGQQESRHLLSKSFHLDLLDQFSGALLLRQAFHKNYLKFQDLTKQLEAIESETRMRAQKLDFLEFQRDEIKAFNPDEKDDADLEVRLQKLKQVNRVSEFVELAEQALYHDEDSVQSRLHRVMQKCIELKSFDDKFLETADYLAKAKTLTDEFLFAVRDYSRKLTVDPEELHSMEARLSDLRKLQKKYGATIGEIIEFLKNVEKEISNLQQADDLKVGFKMELQTLSKEIETQAERLHEMRTKGAKGLASQVNSELLDLNMKGVIFEVDVMSSTAIHPHGKSEVEFKTRTSKKDEAKPLARFASGGELSRILLSLKTVIGDREWPRTYLFDEVDAGVSGETAEKVGRKLKATAKGQQVICVTHLPQVAAYGDHHFFIQKQTSKTGAQMDVRPLKQDERVREIARLISGEKISKTSLDHARQLLRDIQA